MQHCTCTQATKAMRVQQQMLSRNPGSAAPSGCRCHDIIHRAQQDVCWIPASQQLGTIQSSLVPVLPCDTADAWDVWGPYNTWHSITCLTADRPAESTHPNMPGQHSSNSAKHAGQLEPGRKLHAICHVVHAEHTECHGDMMVNFACGMHTAKQLHCIKPLQLTCPKHLKVRIKNSIQGCLKAKQSLTQWHRSTKDGATLVHNASQVDCNENVPKMPGCQGSVIKTTQYAIRGPQLAECMLCHRWQPSGADAVPHLLWCQVKSQTLAVANQSPISRNQSD
jgi:hypothetical protein